MKAASALLTGRTADPRLAADAVALAKERAGLVQATGVLLILGPAYARHAAPAVLAAARQADCLQVSGMVAPGCFTEETWSLEQPAAAALVIGDGAALAGPEVSDGTRLCFGGTPTLATAWQGELPGFGVLHSEAAVWQHARVTATGKACSTVTGARCRCVHSLGLLPISHALAVDAADAYELHRVDGKTAIDSLNQALPPEIRDSDNPPLHKVCLVRDGGGPPIPIVARGLAGGLMLAEPVLPGESVAWALREPHAAEQDLIAGLEEAAGQMPVPAFGLMFSCIGRGPVFYGGADHDCLAFRHRFPGVPLLGIYGSSQISPFSGRSRLYQNSALTLLFEGKHVQPLP